jgi:hypothetical protein
MLRDEFPYWPSRQCLPRISARRYSQFGFGPARRTLTITLTLSSLRISSKTVGQHAGRYIQRSFFIFIAHEHFGDARARLRQPWSYSFVK